MEKLHAGKVVSYLEIGSGDATASRAFFEEVFGWTFSPLGDSGGGWFQTAALRAGLHELPSAQ